VKDLICRKVRLVGHEAINVIKVSKENFGSTHFVCKGIFLAVRNVLSSNKKWNKNQQIYCDTLRTYQILMSVVGFTR
jgi:hypothetical protein